MSLRSQNSEFYPSEDALSKGAAMRIGFFIRSLHVGGSEGQLVALARGLQAKGHSVFILVLYAYGELFEEAKRSGIPVHFTNKKGRWDIFGPIRNMAAVLRDERPDVLYTFLTTQNVLSICLRLMAPETKVVWGLRSSNDKINYRDRLEHALGLVEARLSRFADLIITNSHAGYRTALERGFPASRLRVIPNGIDTAFFAPSPAHREPTRRTWGISSNALLIGLVGRIDPVKDHLTFVRAAALLHRKRPDIQFVIVGGTNCALKDALMRDPAAEGLGDSLRWIDTSRNMPAVYSAIDILTSSSYNEGFSNSIAEAMSSGKVCVVTDVGDSAWLVGKSGIVVPPRDPEALCAGWERCLESNLVELGMKARVRIEADFSIGNLVSETERTLSGLVDKEARKEMV